MQRLFHSYNKNLSANCSRKSARLRAVASLLCCLLANFGLPACGKDETVWHLKQLHRALGSAEIYITPQLMRLDKGNGDIVVLYRQDTGMVYIYNPAHKAIFSTSLERFFKRGFIVTAGGLGPIRTWYPKESKPFQYKGQPASIVEIYARGRNRSGKPTEINCAEMKLLATKGDFRKAVSVIETIYATPITGLVPIELRMNYSQEGGELWFQTHEKELKEHLPNTFFRLQTSKISREKKPAEFFAVPKNFKVMKTDADIMNLTDTASDLTNLVLP
jgi:hypothetical protein